MKREVKFSSSACFTDEFFLLRNAAKYLLNINEKVNHSLISPSGGGWQNSFMLCVAFIQFRLVATSSLGVYLEKDAKGPTKSFGFYNQCLCWRLQTEG